MSEDIAKVLNDSIGQLETRLIANQTEQFEEVGKRLLSLEERDSHPGDEKVQDLEKRQADFEAKQKAIEEDMRFMKSIPQLERDGGPKAKDWGGCFISKAMEEKFHETRTIDIALLASGGLIPEDSADSFINSMADQTVTLSRITTRRMRGPTANLDELVHTPRLLIAGSEASAPAAVADSVVTARRTLNAVEVIHAEDISLHFLEDNIAQGNGEQAVMDIVQRGFANDLNDLGLNGRDADAGAFLGILDGFIVEADGDAAVIDKDLTTFTDPTDALRETAIAMPSQFRALPGLGFIVNPNHAMLYADAVASRVSALGDQVLINGMPDLRYFGKPVIADGHMSDSTVSILSDRQVIHTPLTNLVWGMQRSVTVDAEWKPRTRVVEYTITARVDFNHAMGAVYVKGHSLPVALRG